MKRSSLFIILFIIVTLSAGVYVRSLYSPVIGDDIAYSYKIVDNDTATSFISEPLMNIRDLVDSQICHYKTTNGRAVIHTFVQWFDGIAGIEWFRFFNALVFGATIFLMSIFTWGWKRLTPLMVTSAAFLMLFCVPDCSSLWYVPVYSINYLWSIFAALVFLLTWQHRDRLSWGICCILFPLMIILGWSHEAVALPISGMILIYYFRHRNEFRSPGVLLTLGYGLGALGILLAPGNFVRIQNRAVEYHGFLSWIANHIIQISAVKYLDIVIIVLFAVFLLNRKLFNKIIIRSWLPLGIGLLATILLLILCVGSGRTGTMVNFFMLIVILQMTEKFIRKCSGSIITTIAILVTVSLQWLVIREMTRIHSSYEEMIVEYLATEDGTIVAKCSPMYIPKLAQWVQRRDMNIDPESEYNEIERRSYGVYFHHPTNAPISVMDFNEYAAILEPDSFFTPNCRLPGSAGVYHKPGFRHMIKPLADEENNEGASYSVTYDLSDNGENLSIRKRIRKKLYGLPESVHLASTIVVKNGRRFVLLAYPSEGFKIKSIDCDFAK